MYTDVKFGSGAFQETAGDAIGLAESMVHAGEANGLIPTVAYITSMDAPLGQCIGNWCEVQECYDILCGDWIELHRDLILLTLVLAGQMIHQAGLCATVDAGIDQSLVELRSRRPLQRFLELVQTQGGQWNEIPRDLTPRCSIKASRTGYICRIDAGRLGRICAQTLGAGRLVAGTPVDPLAGIVMHVQVGDYAHADQNVLWDVYCSGSISLIDLQRVAWEDAVEYSDEPMQEMAPIVTHRVTSMQGAQPYTIPVGLQNQVDAIIKSGLPTH
jgi:thymidine phosphorylase